MRSRSPAPGPSAFAAIALAAAGSLLVAACSGPGLPAEEVASPTTAPSTSTMTPTTTTTTTTTPPTTTTTTIASRLELQLRGPQSERLAEEIAALYLWMADPSAEPPTLPAGLEAHLEPSRADTSLDLQGKVHSDELADGTGVAVALIADDLVLAVDDGSGWRIVGARLTTMGLEPWYGDPVRYVLVLGTDARPGQPPPEYRADSIHIVSASLTRRGGGIVGFPRDSWVNASYGNDKLSSVNVRGGTAEMVEIAERLSGTDIEGYFLTGFAGFKHLVNAFGGVEVDVPFRMADDPSNAFLEAGLQVLKGGEALAFSRNRHIYGADFTRSLHQGMVISAGLTGAQAMGVERLPELLQMLTADTWTDLSAEQLLQLGAIAYELDPALVGNIVLPGTVGSVGRISVVRLTSGVDRIFEDLADGVIEPG